MELEHRFAVPADIDTVWTALLDPERVAPCLPGTTLTGVDGPRFTGTVKVKLGPISLLYRGTGEFTDRDDGSYRLVIKASGKDAKGNGTAAATVTLTLTADGPDSTTGNVATDLTITGKPAQLGRGLISEVGARLLDTFATNLADTLTTPEPAATPLPDQQPEAPANDKEDIPTSSTPGDGPPPAGERDEHTPAAAEPDHPAAETEGPPASADDQPQPSAADDSTPAAGQPGQATGESATKAPPLRAVTPEAEPIDLLEYAGAPVGRRLLPVVVAVAVALLVLFWRRRR
ncbi:SRPBCC domain-containing protein [Actinokineospora auranticolor]|uniref:Carbon monoxide dehydrogenase subunit G n=1 Tax=Actinokineospora auranticolor TaxID=155976 RepID=A0A2S6GZ91_9PSEU|nr:SRPBCC family protein [Actinokineospora auranticolor]PPK70554.1 carbon monoxide dehydrogenase subunit G [Actinokineospora auranticolor]